MTPEEMQKRIEDLEYKLNQFIKVDKYLFQKKVQFIKEAGFYGIDPVAQPSSSGTTSDMTTVGGTTVTESNGFAGGVGGTYYTIGDLVKHLKALGLLAQ